MRHMEGRIKVLYKGHTSIKADYDPKSIYVSSSDFCTYRTYGVAMTHSIGVVWFLQTVLSSKLAQQHSSFFPNKK